MDKCEECDNQAEYLVMLEGDEDPYKHETKNLCAECLYKHKASVIDSWTKNELLNTD